jgi:putative transposase
MNVIQEAYVKGVSTRKIDKLTKTSGVESISRSQVSAITKDLNQQVKTMAVIVSIGITTERKWDISALELMCEKSTATYIHVFDRLKKRGVEQVYL